MIEFASGSNNYIISGVYEDGADENAIYTALSNDTLDGTLSGSITNKPYSDNNTTVIPPVPPADEQTLDEYTVNYCKNNPEKCGIELNTTITSTITNDKINNLSNGWYLMGTSTPINSLTIFDNVKFVWKYNNNKVWEAYSPDNNIQSLINKAGIDTLQDIKADEGFWINK